MKLKQVGSNQTKIVLKDGSEVFFSYETPVAAYLHAEPHGAFYKTDCRWSRTTTRHINQWLQGVPAEEKPQSFFDDLLG
jgi:hypothetical protein